MVSEPARGGAEDSEDSGVLGVHSAQDRRRTESVRPADSRLDLARGALDAQAMRASASRRTDVIAR